MNRRDVEYQPGDLVWLHRRKERFPTRRKGKLMARGDGPFRVLAKVGANVYKLELPRDVAVSVTFSVGDLSPCVEDEIDYRDLRANPLKEGEDDAYQGTVQATQSEEGKSLLTDHLKEQFYKGKQYSFNACLGRSLLCWAP